MLEVSLSSAQGIYHLLEKLEIMFKDGRWIVNIRGGWNWEVCTMKCLGSATSIGTTEVNLFTDIVL
jgi:hypothetical protein